MLGLNDFIHLPELEPRFAEMVAAGPGLVVTAGLDPRPHAAEAGVAPSGRATIFRILAREMLEARGGGAVVAGSRDVLRLPRRLQRQVSFHLAAASGNYPALIEEACLDEPPMVVVERLEVDTIPAVLAAAAAGHTVLTQMDTVFRGKAVVRSLAETVGAGRAAGAVLWVLTVQRWPTLCPECKEEVSPLPGRLEAVARRYPDLTLPSAPRFYQAEGCPACRHSGRKGHIAAFDLYHAGDESASFPLEQYLLQLAAGGFLPLTDLFRLEEGQLQRTYQLLGASERALAASNETLARRVAELESAYQVLQRRTQTLVSLQDLSEALITGTGLGELALRVCRHTCELSGADRAILYYLRADQAEVLAAHGWAPERLPRSVSPAAWEDAAEGVPYAFNQWPPGVTPRDPNVEGAALRAGLAVPLVAQGERVGVLLLHSEQNDAFGPGEKAMLQTFANQAALALQRAGLVNRLREKVAALEAAQVALAQKERMERELELARQVQESMLPQTFPSVEGFQFAAHSRPARRVGGDFYDVFSLGERRFGVAIADVSDKGMAAALYMALTRSLLLAESGRSHSPAAVLARVNDLLLRLGEGEMFVTIFYGIVDAATQTLRYARAGHDRPFLFHAGGWSELEGSGTALGILPTDSLNLADAERVMAPGDRLYLYSDGLTDVLSPQGEIFDRQRLAALFHEHATLSLGGCCEATFAALAAFQGDAEQHDDMTLLALEVLPAL